MSETYFVMVPVRGVEKRWPENGEAFMRYKGEGTMALGWVKADTPEDAVARFIDISENAPPELAEEIQARATGPAQVGILKEIVEVPL